MPYYQPGDIILRDYKIEAFIGQGGFGEVYRAVDLNLHEPVALKILRRSTGCLPAAVKRSYCPDKTLP